MSTDLTAPVFKFRKSIPEAHKVSIDTRLNWLWHQRFGTVQNIWKHSEDLLDKTAATMILQAILGKDLKSIQLLFTRLEGGYRPDVVLLDEGLGEETMTL